MQTAQRSYTKVKQRMAFLYYIRDSYEDKKNRRFLKGQGELHYVKSHQRVANSIWREVVAERLARKWRAADGYGTMRKARLSGSMSFWLASFRSLREANRARHALMKRMQDHTSKVTVQFWVDYTIHKEKEAAVLARLAAMNVGNDEPESPVAPKKPDKKDESDSDMSDSDIDITTDEDDDDVDDDDDDDDDSD